MSGFLASKRVASILGADDALTWTEAGEVIDNLNGEDGHEISRAFTDCVIGLFPESKIAIVEQPEPVRGQVFQSHRLMLRVGQFDLVLGMSFTICVRLASPIEGLAGRASRSKFWCSAIISSAKTPEPGTKSEEEFAGLCKLIDNLAVEALEKTKNGYERAIKRVYPKVGHIFKTKDSISIIITQVDDQYFRSELNKIVSKKLRLSTAQKSRALRTLNNFYSGRFADFYLHRGRDDVVSNRNISIDSLVFTDPLEARAFSIETRDNKSKNVTDHRILGVTCSTEPVRKDLARARQDPVYRMLHAPASVLSAEMAAQIGAQF